jgi:hypothetical protein
MKCFDEHGALSMVVAGRYYLIGYIDSAHRSALGIHTFSIPLFLMKY